MKMFILALVLGNLIVAGTAPRYKNPAPCGDGSYYSYASPWAGSPTLRIVMVYFGPIAAVRTLDVKPGAPFMFVQSVPPGPYVIAVYAKNGALVGCDTTIVRYADVSTVILTP